MIYQYVLVERRSDGEVIDFVCDHFPQKEYPVRDYKELYRETVTDLTQLTQYWIDGHNADTRRELNAFRRRGKDIL